MYSSNSQGNHIKIYDSKFVQNVGAIIFTLANKLNMLISGSNFINNSAPIVMMFATDSNILTFDIESIGYKVFVNNNEPIIRGLDSESTLVMNISHNVFIGNNASLSVLMTNGRVITSVDHNSFIDNIGGIIPAYLEW